MKVKHGLSIQQRKNRSRRIITLEEACIGCRLCEVYCIVQHSISKDLVKAFRKETPRPLSRIRIEERKPISFGVQCRHCDEPYCVYACFTGAMHREKAAGIVLHDAERCINCGTCIAFCPYNAIQRNPVDGKIASKCDLCVDLEIPACVANCPNQALVLKVDESKCSLSM